MANKGGRPKTGRDTAVTIRLSKEALEVLAKESNKSEFIDSLIRGEAGQIVCPHCGATIKIELK